MFDLTSIDTTHGIKSLLASFCGLVIVYIAKDIIKGVISFMGRNKRPTRDEFTALTKALQDNQEVIKHQDAITTKMALDIQRMYLFLKVLAGDKWPDYYKKVQELEAQEKDLSFTKSEIKT